MMTSFVACVSMPIGSRPDLGPSSSSVALQTHFKAIALVEMEHEAATITTCYCRRLREGRRLQGRPRSDALNLLA
jgi:hypothetical protein